MLALLFPTNERMSEAGRKILYIECKSEEEKSVRSTRTVQWDGIENEAHIETMVLSSGLNLDVDLFQNPLRSRKSLHNEQDVIAAPNAWTTARLSLGFGIVYPTEFYERRRGGGFR